VERKPLPPALKQRIVALQAQMNALIEGWIVGEKFDTEANDLRVYVDTLEYSYAPKAPEGE
jgi:hypothetical protein